MCVDTVGVTDITHVIKRCNNRRCRTYYGYNFKILGHDHVNTYTASDFTAGVLFISAGRCFTTRFLHCHENLVFRGYLSTASVDWSYKNVFGNNDVVVDFRKQINDALFYFMAMKEFEDSGEHKTIVIGKEISARALMT